MDFNSNCVFIDESAFHINLKRTMAWSKKGTRAEVVQLLTRAKTTTILGAISPFGVINVKVRAPYAEASKKRKVTGGTGFLVQFNPNLADFNPSPKTF
ncbi:hypothetical protein G6F56_010210 [Rhizopus delemar]|nr:hypothetical protein G6F56_010210 [Rhizopus delemar]